MKTTCPAGVRGHDVAVLQAGGPAAGGGGGPGDVHRLHLPRHRAPRDGADHPRHPQQLLLTCIIYYQHVF